MDSIKYYIHVSMLLVLLTACGGGSGPAVDQRVTGFPIAYVKRPFPIPNPDAPTQVLHPDARNPLLFNPGSDLYIRAHASARAAERNISLSVTRGVGDVKDVEVSYDAKRLLFALKEADIEGRQPDEQPTWNIWEYNIETDQLRKIIEQDVFSEEGHDVAPHYLPDGRIIFSSTRQYGSKETLANEGKPRYTSLVEGETVHAMMLHVMNRDGTEIRQITYGLGIDMDPYVRKDGKVIFSRWDTSSNQNGINLYSVNPDGTGLQLLYGAHSHVDGPSGPTPQFTQLRESPDGRVLTILRPYSDTFGGGDIGLIDTERFADLNRPTINYAGISGTGQESVTQGEASADVKPSMGGRYISAFPLWDGSGRSLISWTPCRLVSGVQNISCTEELLAYADVVEAEPVYNLYIYDPVEKTRLPIFLPESGIAITDAVAANPRDEPRLLDDTVATSTDKTGVIHIRSVYDYDGEFDPRGSAIPVTNTQNPLLEFIANGQADDRNARFIRLIKPFVRPDRDDLTIPNLANSGGELIEIIGYAPIEPDGSVKVQVPANTPFSFQIVDKNGRRIDELRHMYWLNVRNGETLECNGCHDHNAGIPHGRQDGAQALNKGAAVAGPFSGQSANLIAQAGETMAETRTRKSCEEDNCRGLKPSVDIVYNDVWSLTPAASFSYSYNDVFNFSTDETPTSSSCVTNWLSTCRVIINYVTHIDPLWSKPRMLSDGITNVTCSQSGCHSPVSTDVDVDGNPIPQVPKPSIPIAIAIPIDGSPRLLPGTPIDTGSQLNLDNVSLFDADDDAARLEAYTELLRDDNAQELVDNTLIDAVFDVETFDPETGLSTGYTSTNIPTRPGPPMSARNANGSRFFNIFTDTTDATHYDPGTGQGILSPAELKLISEWLDVGAQYYNDPFAVPQD